MDTYMRRPIHMSGLFISYFQATSKRIQIIKDYQSTFVFNTWNSNVYLSHINGVEIL